MQIEIFFVTVDTEITMVYIIVFNWYLVLVTILL